ncbi:MAG: hypothetical protein GXO63_01185 [Candidatus Micrarchaeota archaeon]|nr:hypothetical protein [Candidatus Micrarchaeota archaeon]
MDKLIMWHIPEDHPRICIEAYRDNRRVSKIGYRDRDGRIVINLPPGTGKVEIYVLSLAEVILPRHIPPRIKIERAKDEREKHKRIKLKIGDRYQTRLSELGREIKYLGINTGAEVCIEEEIPVSSLYLTANSGNIRKYFINNPW